MAPLLLKPVVGYLAGLVTGPLVKSLARGMFKGTIKVGMRVQKVIGEAAAEMQESQASAKVAISPLASATKGVQK